MVVLNPRSTAYQAARAMADNHIGAVLVGDRPGVAGITTDRDLALAVLGGGLDPKTTQLGEVMSEEVVTCDIGADLNQVVRLYAATWRSAHPPGRGRPAGWSRDIR
jgi:CBS domain-containing protein